MEETLKMMKGILLGNEGGKDLNSLIEEYKIYESPNILAFLFVENYGIMKTIGNMYPIIDDNDKASFCLQEIDKCIFNYNGIAKFSTYLAACYRNRLKSEYSSLATNKRKIIFAIENIDDYIEDNSLAHYDDSIEDVFDLDNFVKQYKLTKYEKEECNLLLQGYTIKEISKKLNKSIELIFSRRTNIRKKILSYGTEIQ